MILVTVLKVFLLLGLTWADPDDCGTEPENCQKNYPYSRVDGTCNNLKHPTWGSTNSLLDRLVPPNYGNGQDSFPLSISGKELPNARSLTIHATGEKAIEDPEFTLTCMQYGELVTHDLSSNHLFRGPSTCCTQDLKFLDKPGESCSTIPIPEVDPHYNYVNATCLSLLRTTTNRKLMCAKSLKYAEKVSSVNSYLDISVIYGNTEEILKSLRSFKNGTLLLAVRRGKEWLLDSITKAECPVMLSPTERCYRTGDERVGQNPQLIVLHVLWAREHNRIARELQVLNAHWNDEKIFHEARRIAIAEHQQITYYEMLPCYLGYENCRKQKLVFDKPGFVNDYDDSMKPNVFNEHAHGAFKHYHSTVAERLYLFNGKGCPFSSVDLRDYMNRGVLLEEDEENFDGLTQGLSIQPQMASDNNIVPDITRFAFMRGLRFGTDIRAIDVQRGRDHGLGSYNSLRKYCGLRAAKYFEDFLDLIDKENINRLKTMYVHPDDVDLLIGGGMERLVNGTRAGPTFLCIMYKQFKRTRTADRFWYENKSSGLTLEQLKEIRKMKISKLFCNNGNNITHIHEYGFLQGSKSNTRVSCSTIKGPNLKLWKEKV